MRFCAATRLRTPSKARAARASSAFKSNLKRGRKTRETCCKTLELKLNGSQRAHSLANFTSLAAPGGA